MYQVVVGMKCVAEFASRQDAINLGFLVSQGGEATHVAVYESTETLYRRVIVWKLGKRIYPNFR